MVIEIIHKKRILIYNLKNLIYIFTKNYNLFIIISNKLSKDNLFTKIASKFKIYWTVFYISILFPFLAGISYNIGGSMEKGNSIAWGCYIEDFLLSSIIWLFIGTILFFVMIYGLINPWIPFHRCPSLFLYLWPRHYL